ncbi:NAD(P)-binding domain-containing protein [Geodermatophilus sp. YIM 151500]|uniref:NADPH-dependent F420 reductase n=1 Tax=Geodermatophilus sp. YIM 151500 TaxID=2984531 RepID=UPI0021E4B172|nr:NAD(P)-binding domain-containing protein [Geodermatophilus sp. YIM 151500]MCV2490364.1 NAD(P)-binding domain-containing protein [Geodermatophilus sp. YIM 151500]
MRIGIVGSGQVARALARGYAAHGHRIRLGTRQAEVEGLPVGSPAEAVRDADLVVLAVRGTVAVDLVTSLAEALEGRVLVDATNPLEGSTGVPRLFVGHTDSLGERVQRAAPRARVVKAYNIVGNALMVDPQLPGGPPTMFIAGDDDAAKATVTGLLQETGWDVADLGGIEASRLLEPMCLAWVAYGARTGTWSHALKLLHAD